MVEIWGNVPHIANGGEYHNMDQNIVSESQNSRFDPRNEQYEVRR